MSELVPGSIVLTKVKGFSPWPSMIIPEDRLPEDILSKKPKVTTTKPKSKTSKGSDVEILAVRFFNDDTYVWTNNKNVTPLNESVIASFLNDGKKRKDKLLINAYQLSKEPPSLEDFVKWGSYGEPVYVPEPEIELKEESMEENDNITEVDSVEDEYNEEDDYEVLEPPKKKKKTSGATKSKGKDEKIGKLIFNVKGKGKAAIKTAKKGSKKTEKKRKVIKVFEEEEEDEELIEESDYDSDWGVDTVTENGDSVCDINFPKSGEITNSINERYPLLVLYKIQLQSIIMNGDNYKGGKLKASPKHEALEILTELKSMKNLQTSIILKSNLSKLFFCTLRRFDFNDNEIRSAIGKLVQKWFDIKIEKNSEPVEEIIEEANPEPKQEAGSGDSKEDNVPVELTS